MGAVVLASSLQCREDVARCVVGPVMDQQPGGSVYWVQETAPDQGLPEFRGISGPLKG